MTFGECVYFPPSVPFTIAVLCYLNRLHHMSANCVVKQVYNELKSLHDVNFTTWVTHAEVLLGQYNIDIELDRNHFKSLCKQAVQDRFISDWEDGMNDIVKHPILLTYVKIKIHLAWNHI